MIVAGIDMGSLTTKAVILRDGQSFLWSVMTTTGEGEVQARRTLEEALKGSGLSQQDIDYIIVTGGGRKLVLFANNQKSLLSCLAKGANWLFPSARTVIDVGAETCTIVRVNEKGRAEDSASSDRCASGTGVFLDSMAKLMQMPLEQMARLSLEAKGTAEISSMCAIFAEGEVISHVHREPPTPKSDIIAGIHASMATRITGFAKRVEIKQDVILTGGVAKNVGFVKALGKNLGVKLSIPEEPQLVPAMGAACIAQEEGARKLQR